MVSNLLFIYYMVSNLLFLFYMVSRLLFIYYMVSNLLFIFYMVGGYLGNWSPGDRLRALERGPQPELEPVASLAPGGGGL